MPVCGVTCNHLQSSELQVHTDYSCITNFSQVSIELVILLKKKDLWSLKTSDLDQGQSSYLGSKFSVFSRVTGTLSLIRFFYKQFTNHKYVNVDC